jgi:lycopene beta-cyclase
MDFRIEQNGETRFFYVLPKDEHTALVEIAIFSSNIPEPSFYDPYLIDYIDEYVRCKKYEIIEEELNAIPMTDFNFSSKQSSRIINIGTNGGSVKGSSGYAYKYIQKETDRIVNHIIHNKIQKYKPLKNRYKFYDSIFLNAILTGKTSGETVFGKLFKKLDPQLIFRFLDEEASFFDDLRVFTAPPTLPFTKAFVEEVFKSR